MTTLNNIKMLLKIAIPLFVLVLVTGCGGTSSTTASNNPDTPENPAAPDDPENPAAPDDPVTPDDPPYVAKNAPLLEDRSVYDQDTLDIKTLDIAGAALTDTALQAVNDDTDPDNPTPVKVTVYLSENGYEIVTGDGTTSPSVKAALSQRGQSTRLALQKSYKIKLDKKTYLWRNHRTLELNKHPYDLTRMRNKLSFDYFKIIPDMASLRTQYVKLYITTVETPRTYYGLYTLIESPGDISLEQHGLDVDGLLYKAEYFEFNRYADKLLNVDDPAYNLDTFETVLSLKGAEDDHTKLIAMLEAVNDISNDINDVIENYFNRENFLTWLATNILFGNEDTNSQNFMLYSPTTEDGFYFIGWDYDGAWGFYNQPSQAAVYTRPRWTRGISNWWNVVLIKRFIKDPDNLSDLTAKMDSLLDNYITPTQTEQFLSEYRSLIVDDMLIVPDLWNLPSPSGDAIGIRADMNAEIDRLVFVPQENFNEYINTIERPMPVFIGDPVIGSGIVTFFWDASYDLQGDSITYDLQISDDPSFGVGHIISETTGLTATTTSVSGLASGTYYFRVIIRDTKDPANNWQLPFDQYWDGASYHDGMKQFTIL